MQTITILNLEQIGEQIHYKASTMRTMIAKGEHGRLPPMFKRDRRWFARYEDVETWKAEHFVKEGLW
ncbi:MAG: hypothetical protein HXX17_11850 [Geobacteraceae bacterium]|nr:hypothetical protein [Geobacteraceae bacterium]